jgi:gliding motility-associated-like protein
LNGRYSFLFNNSYGKKDNVPMKRTLLFTILLIWLMQEARSQSCTAITYDLDLSSSIDTSVSIQSVRNGDCCTGTNCIRFNLIINPACSFVNFSVANPGPNGSAYYQINCGPQTSLATPACVVGMTNVTITFCKPGNDAPTYTITASGAIQGSPDTTIKQRCTGKMGVKGLLLPTINWTSIYPGVQGQYDSYLSCITGCDTVNVTPQQGAPDYIDYQVSGNRLCGGIVYDTIQIYTQAQFTVVITPTNPMICPNGGTTSLSAAAASGNPPYSFVWNTGDTASTINVSAAGLYTVAVSDTSGCAAVIDSVTVNALPVPPAPVISSNAPLCVGSTLNLSASYVNGATYSWTGPNGFVSNQQNPVINNISLNDSGTYSVSVTVNGCTSSSGSANVIVNSIPASPSALNNGPVCEGSTLNLSASNINNAIYNWTGPNSFISSIQNPAIANVSSANAGLYNVTATVNGCTGPVASTTVNINPLPNVPNINSNSPVCSGTTISLVANSNAGASYSWSGPNGFSSSLQNPTILNANTNASGTYFVTATLNGCSSANNIDITVNPIPSSPLAGSNSPICNGTTLDLSASTIANATYNWTGPNNFSSSLQNPTIANATTANSGVYSVNATVNGCASNSSNVNITVNPIPSSPAVSSNSPLCQGSTLSLTAGNIAGASYLWTGPNNFSTSLQNPTIANANTSMTGVYSVTATVNGCTSNPSNINVTVYQIPSAPLLSNNSPACEGSNISLNASSINGASYNWSGPNGFSSSQQNPLIANATLANGGSYTAFVSVNGCSSANASTIVTVNPIPTSPTATNNSAICEGATLSLFSSTIANATYNWTGPGGFTSSTQNSSISNTNITNSGQYQVRVTVNGCVSAAGNTTVVINQHAIANAGNNQTVCITSSSITLNGVVTGGSNSGIWSTNGGGSFSPSNGNLISNYNPTNSDKAAGSVLLTLTSTNNGACPASTSTTSISFAAAPLANAGNDTAICSNASLVLNGSVSNATGGIWSANAVGSFSPSNTNLNAGFYPAPSDVNRGNVVLTLTTTGNAYCPADSKSITVTLKPAPVVNAGADKIIIENYSAILNPIASGQGLKILWSPANYLDFATILNPTCTPKTDITYTITVVDNNGCSAADDLSIKVLKMPVIPNVFTPNNDGINDSWQVKYLAGFTDCSVEIYNRYGQLIYRCTGYNNPWNGTVNGKPVPAATYYYIINLKNNLKPLSGFVDIVR